MPFQFFVPLIESPYLESQGRTISYEKLRLDWTTLNMSKSNPLKVYEIGLKIMQNYIGFVKIILWQTFVALFIDGVFQ